MNFYEFEGLLLDTKKEIVWEDGTFLFERYDGIYKIHLYALYDFYAEIWFVNQSNSIECVNEFKDDKNLDIYVKDINLLL